MTSLAIPWGRRALAEVKVASTLRVACLWKIFLPISAIFSVATLTSAVDSAVPQVAVSLVAAKLLNGVVRI